MRHRWKRNLVIVAGISTLMGVVIIALFYPHTISRLVCDSPADIQRETEAPAVRSSSMALDNVWNYRDQETEPIIRAMNGRVYVSDSHCNRVFAIGAVTGEIVWTQYLMGPGGLYVDPGRDRLYVYVHGGIGRGIVALNGASGDEIWEYSPDGIVFRGSYRMIVSVDGGVSVIASSGSSDVHITELDPESGETVGPRVPLSERVGGAIYTNDRFWRLAGGQLVALTVENVPVWESAYRGIDGCCLHQVLVQDDVIVVRVGPDLIALDAAVGNLLWRNDGNFVAGPVLLNGMVFALDWNAELFVFDLMDGTQIGSVDFAGLELSDRDLTASSYSIGSSALLTANDTLVILFGDTELVAGYRLAQD